MVRYPAYLIAGTILLAISACAHSPAAEQTAPPEAARTDQQQVRVPGEYLVTLRPDTDEKALEESFGSLDIKDVNELGGDTYLMVVSKDPGPKAMKARARKDSRIRKIQPNLVYWANRSGSKPVKNRATQ